MFLDHANKAQSIIVSASLDEIFLLTYWLRINCLSGQTTLKVIENGDDLEQLYRCKIMFETNEEKIKTLYFIQSLPSDREDDYKREYIINDKDVGLNIKSINTKQQFKLVA